MRQPTLLIAFTLCTTLAAAPASAQTGVESVESARSSIPTCPRVTFSTVEKPQAMRGSFSASRTTDLILHVLFDRSLDTDLMVTLKVYTPKGHLYRQYDVPLASGYDKRATKARRIPGYPYPVPVQTTSTVKAGKRKYESADIPMPVAGTAIVTSSLYGRWSVEVCLDGASEPCRKPTFFHLRQ
jgi:hypothetical protein